MQRIRNAAPWLLGILAASLLFALLFAFSSFQYSGSDDAPILRSFMGYEGGEPATFHLYLHTALAWLLWGLAKLAPGVAWFSILQLALLWFSQVVIVKSFAQLTRRRGFTVWPGTMLGILFLAGYAVYVTCRVSYTTTSALIGAAAVAQLASVDFGRRRSAFGPVLGSIGLLLCAYCLRQISVLPPLCFWALMFAAKLRIAFGKGRRPWRHARSALAGALAGALLFGAFAALREEDIRLSGTRPLLNWQAERIKLFDYTDFDSTTTPETLAKLGWSDSEFTLFTYWYFLDDNMTVEAMQTLNAQQVKDDTARTAGDRLRGALTTTLAALRRDPFVRYGAWAALAMALAALTLALRRRQNRLWPSLATVAAVLGGALLLGYLGYSGRLPMRAAVSVLFPCAAFLWGACLGAFDGGPMPAPEEPAVPARAQIISEGQAVPASVQPSPGDPAADAQPHAAKPRPRASAQGHAPRATTPVFFAALAAAVWLCGVAALDMAALVRPAPRDEEVTNSDQNMADLDAYALENPDTLIIYDMSQLGDHRLFPETPAEGLAGNALFWGGYPARTPSWYQTFAKYGVTSFDPTLFLRDNVLLASTDPEPWPSLMQHIEESTDENVDWEYYDSTGYVNLFRIVTF